MIRVLCYARDNMVECSAAIMGIAGGFLYPSVDTGLRVTGAVLWCIGNALWLIFAHGHRKWALFALQAIYMVQNVFAVWNVSMGGVM